MSGAAWLAIWPDGAQAWSGVGWFHDRDVQASWGAGLRRTTETGWEQALAEASSRLTGERGGRGWWYIWNADTGTGRLGRSEPREFGNVEWISRSRGLGMVGADGRLHPYPA